MQIINQTGLLNKMIPLLEVAGEGGVGGATGALIAHGLYKKDRY